MYLSKENLLAKITEIINDSDDSLTSLQISTELGYPGNSSRVIETLDQLVSEGKIAKNSDTGTTIYSAVNIDEDEDEEEIDDETDATDELDPATPPVEIQAISLVRSDLFGYDAISLEKGHIKVVFPDGVGEKILEPGENLVVINQDAQYRFVIHEAAELTEAIAIYTDDKNLGTFTIEDMAIGKAVPNADSLNYKNPIIFLQINKHDKGGN